MMLTTKNYVTGPGFSAMWKSVCMPFPIMLFFFKVWKIDNVISAENIFMPRMWDLMQSADESKRDTESRVWLQLC